jgi:hypothetical protein
VRQKLIDLRARIAREFPFYVEPKQRLLRDQMITVLLEDRPTTEKEWIDKLPLWMRKDTDQRQVSMYLPAILEIFAQMGEHSDSILESQQRACDTGGYQNHQLHR